LLKANSQSNGEGQFLTARGPETFGVLLTLLPLQRFEPHVHNDKDIQLLFAGYPKMYPTNPRWPTAAIF